MLALVGGTATIEGCNPGVGICAVFLVFHALNYSDRIDRQLARLHLPIYSGFFGVAFAFVSPAMATSYTPFIYFQF